MANNKKYKSIPTSELLLLGCVLFSILLSLYLFFISKEPMYSIFVGLWAPTIMGLINYINLKFKRF